MFLTVHAWPPFPPQNFMTLSFFQYKIGTRDVFDGPCMTPFSPTKSHDPVPVFQYKIGTRDVLIGPCMIPIFSTKFRDTIPTFQYKIGTRDVFDGKRRPAWTDRILYRVNTSNYDNYK